MPGVEKGSLDEVIVVLQRDTYAAKGHGNLLALLLARYPQLGTLQILPQSRTMRFGFFVKGPWDVARFTKFGEHLGKTSGHGAAGWQGTQLL